MKNKIMLTRFQESAMIQKSQKNKSFDSFASVGIGIRFKKG